MKYDKLLTFIKSGNVVIPLYIYKDISKLNIDCETFVFLMFLYNKGNDIPFNVNKLSEEFFCDTKTVMKYISILQEKKLLEIKVVKNDKNIMEEYISLNFFYEKISLDIVNEDNKPNIDEKRDIFDMLEKDVGLQLSSVEVELVKAWNYNEELIVEAIKEAIKNKVASIRYIDKILYEWSKKGYKTKEDVLNSKKNFREREKNEPKVDLFDYDWIEDDE